MKLGTTSFGYRYSFLDPAHSPLLADVIRHARSCGVERFQVCENTRPLAISDSEWSDAIRTARELGVELGLGCKTLRASVVAQYIELAKRLPTRRLRIVMEEDDGTHATPELAQRLFDEAVPMLQRAGMQLAVENHFDIPSATLLAMAERFPAGAVGFCVDTANSLRSFETPEQVIGMLAGRACCYHLKDYRIVGSKVSFSVVGAPLGEGLLDLDGCVGAILARDPSAELYVETWTPSEDDRDKDIATEADWLKRSMANLRKLVK